MQAHFQPAAAGLSSRGQVQPRPRTQLYAIIDQLVEVREEFNLPSKAVSILRALASFAQEVTPDGRTIVWPSNACLSDRLDGMPISTLNRHIARIADIGFVVRNASPNFKRYARRQSSSGRIAVAFGYDLTPLIRSARLIAERLAARRIEQEKRAALCDRLGELRRCFPLGSPIDQEIVRIRRRKSADSKALAAFVSEIEAALETPPALPSHDEPVQCSAEEVSNTDAQIEQHQQNRIQSLRKAVPKETELPLHRILPLLETACSFLEQKAGSFRELFEQALYLAPMIGIRDEVIRRALGAMTPEMFAVVLMGIVERMDEIDAPAAYLDQLTQKAAAGQFDLRRFLLVLQKRP